MTNKQIIDTVVSGDQSKKLVRKMIPILVQWAKAGYTNKTYGDMNQMLGYTRFSGIGHQLGNVADVLKHLSESTGKEIPTLNTLCKSANTGAPSSGFAYVMPGYSELSDALKRKVVAGFDLETIQYPDWDWVLNELGLAPAPAATAKAPGHAPTQGKGTQAPTTTGYGWGGGEGEEHKAIKEYIAKNPTSVGLYGVTFCETEYDLPSGDRLDVYFEAKDKLRIAVEVKPSTSCDEDIQRGIFQCVKYKAVMDAQRYLDGVRSVNDAKLVCGGSISEGNKALANNLGIDFIENFKIKKIKTDIDQTKAQALADSVAQKYGYDGADMAKEIDGNLSFLLVNKRLIGTTCGYPRGILVNDQYKWRIATQEEVLEMLSK